MRWAHMNKRLYKSSTDRVISGVIGGFVETYNVDANLLRIIYTAITVFSGFFPGLIIYLVAMVVVPEKS